MESYAQQEREREATEFAEWTQLNRWFYFDPIQKEWSYTFEHGTSISKDYYKQHYIKTTEQLYKLFKETKEEK
jgi:hypothetical protein